MIPTLALLSLVLLLLAAAIELWWGSAARHRQRNSLVHIEQSLGGSMRPAAAAAPRTPASAASPRNLGERRAEALFLRAGLPTGWRMPIMLALPGFALAIGAWLRIGSVMVVPLMLGVYGAMVWL